MSLCHVLYNFIIFASSFSGFLHEPATASKIQHTAAEQAIVAYMVGFQPLIKLYPVTSWPVEDASLCA